MFRSISFRLIVLVLGTISLAGCDNTANDTGETPTTPTNPIQVTETFSGSLTAHGATTHPFTVSTAGTVSATLLEITPDNTVTLGLGIGTWNGTTCQLLLPNDSASQGAIVIGAVTASGLLCARVYDAQGTLVGTSNYTITVNHP